jgi:phosphoribosylanthranilate isomerase
MKAPRPDFSELAFTAGVASASGLPAGGGTPSSRPSRSLLKVCGMRDAAALAEVAALKPDFLGFIFCPCLVALCGARRWRRN